MFQRVLVLLAVLAGLLPAPAALARPPAAGKVLPNRYVVLTKPGVDPGAVAVDHRRRLHAKVRFVYRRAVQGYAASMTPGRAASLRHDARVLAVEQDRRV